MSPETQRWQKLNAYVDGELPPGEAAEIAAEIAGDRRLAATVATLTRLKAATAAAGLEGAPAIALAPPAMPLRRWAVAAAVALLIVTAAWALWPAASPDARLAALAERHAAWATQDASEPVDAGAAARLLVGLGRLGVTDEIPDLSDAGLQLARIATFETVAGQNALHVGYVGTRGCRVSLVIEPAAAEPAAAPRRAPAGDMVAAWTVDGVGYVLLASGMHPPRFATIAASAEAATRSRAPLAAPLREAMRGQRDASPPCVG